MKTSRKITVNTYFLTRKNRIGFLTKCQDWYWTPINKEQRDWLERKPLDMPRLVWCYGYGCDKGYLDISFDWFKKIVLNSLDPEAELYPRTYRDGQRWPAYQRPNKYVKGEGHGIKDRQKLDEKNIWRKRLGKRSGHPSWIRSPGRDGKMMRNQSHRQWVMRNLQRERYEVFHGREREVFYGSYCWS